jgi:hypothetical protein
MSNLQQNQNQGCDRQCQNPVSNLQQTGSKILGKEPIVECRPKVVGQQPIIQNQPQVVGQHPIVEQRNVEVGKRPIVEMVPKVVGEQPIMEQREFLVGQQPIIQNKPVIVGQQPVIQNKPAIVGERVLIENRSQQPFFDPSLDRNTNNQQQQQTGFVGPFRQGARIALRSNKDKFIGIKNSKPKLSRKRKETGYWLVESLGGNLFALKNQSNGQYLSCDGNKLDFSSNRGQQEQWRVEETNHSGMVKYLLSNYSGEYLHEGLLSMKLRDHPSRKTHWEVDTF